MVYRADQVFARPAPGISKKAGERIIYNCLTYEKTCNHNHNRPMAAGCHGRAEPGGLLRQQVRQQYPVIPDVPLAGEGRGKRVGKRLLPQKNTGPLPQGFSGKLFSPAILRQAEVRAPLSG